MKNISKIILLLLIIVTIIGVCGQVLAINMPTKPNYDPNNVTSDEIKNKAETVMSTFVYLVQIVCIVTVIFMGLRYMFTSAEGKANIKKELVVWCVGAVIVFSATTLIGLILEFVTGNDEITITPPTSSNPNTNTNSDKEVSDWANEDWQGADKSNLIPGSVKDSKPKDKISRVEFAESIYLLAGKAGIDLVVPVNYKEVSDVSSDDVSEQIQALHNAGIIEGVSGNEAGDIKFDPNSNITRQDVATIMYRLLVKAGKDDRSISLTETQADINKGTYNNVSDYAKEAMIYMNKVGIIIGDEKGNINPKDNTTCEQAIAIIYRTATSHGIVK